MNLYYVLLAIGIVVSLAAIAGLLRAVSIVMDGMNIWKNK